MAVNMFAAISRKGITNDEIVHIPAGYYHLVAGDFQLNNEHPPLIKMWAALPLLLIQPIESPPTAEERQGTFNGLDWSYEHRFWQSNRQQFETILFASRVMMIVLALALGALIFTYANSLFGSRAGLIAVALCTLEPTVLAHGRLVHTDLPAALVFLLFFFVLRKYLQSRTTQNALLLGLASGLALLTKFSMIVLLPVLACLMLAGVALAARLHESRKRLLAHSVNRRLSGIVDGQCCLPISATANRNRRRAMGAGQIAGSIRPLDDVLLVSVKRGAYLLSCSANTTSCFTIVMDMPLRCWDNTARRAGGITSRWPLP